MFNVVEDDFNIAISQDEKNIYAIGLTVWPLFASVMLKRGNSAVTEWVVRGIQLFHDPDHLPKYRFPINMDLLAMFTPAPKLFAKILPALFYDQYALRLADECINDLRSALASAEDKELITQAEELILDLVALRYKFVSFRGKNKFRLWSEAIGEESISLTKSPNASM